ncbi:MAG: GNAT family N-acetyltransferase [Anaerolineae bacterium]|nr:GNAT family N-acetyltransferase [Anaerolineae bacterium]MCI0609106.1 GNAT family N-acetyltransferase [Anaerolineae bacterium]
MEKRPDGFNLRPYTSLDAQAVAEIINASSMRTVGFPRAIVDAVGNIWAYRFVPFSSEKIVAVNHDNQVIGYAYFTSEDDHIASEIGGSVHPDYWGKGIGSTLIHWAEEKARESSHHAPAGVKTVLQTSIYESERDAIALFKDHGYSPVREWVHLVLEMDAQPFIPPLPPNLTLREMDLDNDWDIVGPAMDEAFIDHWGSIPAEFLESESEENHEEESTEQPTDDSYSNAPGYCFIVLDGETVAGGILCNSKLVERTDTGRVGSIFVRLVYRRRGIAQTLMLTAFDAFWKNGFRRVITDTDANSLTDSTKLYRGLGMKPYRSEFTYEKEIRAGKEVRRLD